MRPNSRLAPRVLAAAGLLTIAPAAALAHSGDVVTSGFGTATIDGVQSPGEWDAATPVSVVDGIPGSMLYVMNDGADVFFGLHVPDPTPMNSDSWRIRIDNGHDGTSDTGDDNFFLHATGAYLDLHFSGSFWAVSDDQSHGAGSVSFSGGAYWFEIGKPLNSGDPQDMANAAGDVLGFCMRYIDDGTGLPASNDWPLFCAGATTENFANLVTASPTTGVGEGPPADRIALRTYPNPARLGGRLTVVFSVPVGGARVEIGLRDVSGRRVASFENARYPAGRHVLRIEAPAARNRGLAAGVYFLEAAVGDQERSERVLFLR